MQIAQKLREIRTDRDKSQAEIANVLGTTQQYYGQYELEKRKIPVEHLATLCNYYGVSADYILGLPKGLSWPR
nr:MAG TPA: helix-turn-helix domain protein [Inoviridae sp.]